VSASFVRLAGSGRRDDGAEVTWTIAEGSRGRRWRETVVVDGTLVHSLLYETGIDRRFTHLELATPAGLATLHPETDGTLHGNVVRSDRGVEHVVGVPFSPDGVLLVAGSAIAAAAVAWALGESDARGQRVLELDTVTLSIGPALDPTAPVRASVGSSGATDPRGVPVLADATIWLLERDDEG
jgi:hypothetical protein